MATIPPIPSPENGAVIPFQDPTARTTALIDRAVAALREVLETRLEGAETNVQTRLEGMDRAIALGKENSDHVSGKVPCMIKEKFEEMNLLMVEKFHGVEKVFAERDVRFAGNRTSDQETLNAGVMQIRQIVDEKFFSIDKQFKERDVRVEQTARDTRVAVDAALQAAEKAVGKQNEAFAVATAKSEAATTKQIDQIGVLIATTNKATDEKIDDIKSRFGLMESLIAQINGRSAGVSASAESSDKRSTDSWARMMGVGALVLSAIGILILLLRNG